MKHLTTLWFCLLAALGFSQTIQLETFATGFSNPVEMTNAGDNRLFVVEKSGIIKIVTPDGSINATPFLDISALVGSGGERGLLGLAFSPDYSSSGKFYVNYTDNSSTNTPNTIIARYTVSANPDVANTNGETLLTYQQPYGNHNGGKLAFGRDGFLYIGVGDGGSGGDPQNRAQNITSLFGKLLRIDVSGNSGYSIPNSNPYFDSANGTDDPRPEIYAIGLRNPWKFSFDRTTSDLWIADVGQNDYEEINMVNGSGSPADNYGWRCYEGTHEYNTSANCPAGGLSTTIAPVSEYPHEGSGCSGSITGGYVYRGTNYPNFIGKYFFADYCKQNIGILTNNGSWSLAFQTANVSQGWTTLGEDANGELYIAGGSTIYKITDANLGAAAFDNTDFNLYPNPSSKRVTVRLPHLFDKATSISIYNIQGRKIKTYYTTEKTFHFSVETYQKGLYFVEVNLNNGSRISKKLIIH